MHTFTEKNGNIELHEDEFDLKIDTGRRFYIRPKGQSQYTLIRSLQVNYDTPYEEKKRLLRRTAEYIKEQREQKEHETEKE